MAFRVVALDMGEFRHLVGADEALLAGLGVQRVVADAKPGYPCRVSLQDAEIGESVLLLNYEHLPGDSPYRSRHAIFVRECAVRARPAIGEVPELLRRRLLSIRAFGQGDDMIDADVVPGDDAHLVFDRMLADPAVRYLHVHNAARGCFAARVDRAA